MHLVRQNCGLGQLYDAQSQAEVWLNRAALQAADSAPSHQQQQQQLTLGEKGMAPWLGHSVMNHLMQARQRDTDPNGTMTSSLQRRVLSKVWALLERFGVQRDHLRTEYLIRHEESAFLVSVDGCVQLRELELQNLQSSDLVVEVDGLGHMLLVMREQLEELKAMGLRTTGAMPVELPQQHPAAMMEQQAPAAAAAAAAAAAQPLPAPAGADAAGAAAVPVAADDLVYIANGSTQARNANLRQHKLLVCPLPLHLDRLPAEQQSRYLAKFFSPLLQELAQKRIRDAEAGPPKSAAEALLGEAKDAASGQ